MGEPNRLTRITQSEVKLEEELENSVSKERRKKNSRVLVPFAERGVLVS